MFFILICEIPLRAEEPAANPSPAAAPEQPPATVDAAPKKWKGKRSGEKETEGTQAPSRFQEDTVIKSQYRLNGEPLEVDPD